MQINQLFGGGPRINPIKYNDLPIESRQKLQKEYKTFSDLYDVSENKALFDEYQRLAGEIEARDTQARQKMTPEQRMSTQPYSSQNIPLKQVIARRWKP